MCNECYCGNFRGPKKAEVKKEKNSQETQGGSQKQRKGNREKSPVSEAIL